MQLDDLVGLAGELAVLSDNLQGLREVAEAQAWPPHAGGLELGEGRQIRDTTLDLRMVPVERALFALSEGSSATWPTVRAKRSSCGSSARRPARPHDHRAVE